MIDQLTLKALLTYDAATGEFVWRKREGDSIGNRRWNPRFAGRAAGRVRHGYIVIRIGDKEYAAHRLAWLFCFGEFPSGELDHIDGNPSNNRVANLRPATRSQQIANTRRSVRNSSGFKGVRWSSEKRRWQATIVCDRKFRHLGYYESPRAAHEAYVQAAQALFGAYARAG